MHFRAQLPRKAKDEGRRKAKSQSLASSPVVIDKPLKKRVKRAVKGPGLSTNPDDDNNPNPVHAKNSPEDPDFVPVSIGKTDSTSGTTRSSKKRTISTFQDTSANEGSVAAPSVPHAETISLPETYGQPLIWADERQNLCEALPYYRAYQSGAYTFGNLAYGFLLDKDSSGARSYIDEEIVITRAGGGCKTDASGNMQQDQNQSGDAVQIISFKNCVKQKHAVALILGSANQDCPVVIPHRYCVMDWFQVTDVWAEKFNGKVCYKFRFEKIELEKKSWWASKGSSLPSPTRTFGAEAPSIECSSCCSTSKQIYRDGWMCLNENCVAFFTLNGWTPSNPSYSVAFLNERSQWPKSIRLSSLKPEPLLVDQGNASFNYSRVSWKGMVCPQCGRCNSRVHWARWECHSESCAFSHDIQLTQLSHKLVLSSRGFQGTGHAVPQDKYANPINLRDPAFLGNWRIHTFEVMAGTSSSAVVTHFHANNPINQMSGGANDMFRAMQEADLGLRRFPMKSTRVRGEMLTKHFTSNYGMPYKFVVTVDSKPFKGAPQVIMDGLNRLTWAGKHTVGDATFLQFNELLALGYFEEQSIGYHDDGETDLGPTIATLSLGGEADMTIRMKERYYSARRIKFDPYDPNAPVIEGCQLYEKRRELNARIKGGCSDRVRRAHQAKLRKEVQKISRSSAPVILNMRLHHGDMVVMHGSDMQKYFEHAVTPLGKLRFALTARYVDPTKIDSSEHWKGDFVMDPATAYNGDIDSLNDAARELSLQSQDTPMKDSPIESNISSSFVDDASTEILLQHQDTLMKDNSIESNISSRSLDDASNELILEDTDTSMKDNSVENKSSSSSLDDAPNALSLQNQDIITKDNPIESNNSSSSLDDAPNELSLQNRDMSMKDNPIKSNISSSSSDDASTGLLLQNQDTSRTDNLVNTISPNSLDDLSNEVPNRDTIMKDIPIENSILSSSQLTLVADDPVLSLTQAPDHLGSSFPNHDADNNSVELYKGHVEGFEDSTK